MATFTKAQIIAKIASDLPDNTTNLITPDDLRGVLLNLLDMIQGANFISYLNEDLEGVTNVQGALDALVTLIEGGTLLTASQIRDLLQTLTGTNRLSKAAIQGADFALNRRGKGDVTDTAGFQIGMGNRHKGDYWIFDDGVGGGGGGGGESETLENGDWLICLVNNATLHNTDSGYLDSEQWEVIKFSGSASLSAGTIRDLLETLTGSNMLDGAKVKYDSSTSVAGRITAILGSFTDYQLKTIHKRHTVGSVGADSVSFVGQLKIISMHLNGVRYFGKYGTEGEYEGLDYVFTFVSGNTFLYLNPELGLSFEGGAKVDILHE